MLERLEVPVAPVQRPGAVLVADPLSIRARRFRAIVVCGLQESEFPLAGRAEPFLSDELRRELAACSGLRLRPREDALARERYLFYTSVSAGHRTGGVELPQLGRGGQSRAARAVLADVGELLVEDWPERRRRRMLADVVWPAAAAPTRAGAGPQPRRSAAAPASGEVPSPIASLGEAALAHVRHRRILSAGALRATAPARCGG